MPQRFKLDDFPDSPFARELRRGLARLRFDAPLEAEYRVAQVHQSRLRVRVWFTLVTTLTLLFTVAEARRAGVGSAFFLLRVSVLIPSAAVLAWLAWSRWYARWYPRVAPVLAAIVCSLIAVVVAKEVAEGRTENIAGLTGNVLALFLFAGLLFRQALAACAVTIVAFATAAAFLELPAALLGKCLVILVLTAVICAIVGHDSERAARKGFLESGLIEALAAHDGLTGLLNRRAFDEHLQRVWQQATRDQRSIAVLMIDVDHFKRYNDTLGHQAGDFALRCVAAVVQGVARRPLDVAARYGGEEFSVILYDLAPSLVHEVAERLRQGVQDLRIRPAEHGSGEAPELTVSVGVGVAAPSMGRTAQGAVQLADQALYRAKQTGRNRVAVLGLDAYAYLETGDFLAPKDHRR